MNDRLLTPEEMVSAIAISPVSKRKPSLRDSIDEAARIIAKAQDTKTDRMKDDEWQAYVDKYYILRGASKA
ncbi:hypothetical protein LCGC14_2082860 [marine sediment metagenome]|uniref:Uncharacterized protein n=1 Tax=marine sediment metagenome TaxID=412755 RepID=A0A0F9F2A8_9ZZZZ